MGGAAQLRTRAASRCSDRPSTNASVPPLPTVDRWSRPSGTRVSSSRRKASPAAAAQPSIRCRRRGTIPATSAPPRPRTCRAFRSRISASLIPHITMGATVGVVREQMRPRVALANLARAIVSTGDNVLPPTAPGVTPVGTETVMMAPSFPQPMYEPLKEKSQDLLLPGLDKVEPETVVGLRTNRAFVEAYMIGLNCRDGARAPVARVPDRPAGHLLQTFLGNRHRQRPLPPTSTICARTSAARSARRRRMRPRISSCCCCGAACCAATRTRSSI